MNDKWDDDEEQAPEKPSKARVFTVKLLSMTKEITFDFDAKAHQLFISFESNIDIANPNPEDVQNLTWEANGHLDDSNDVMQAPVAPFKQA